MVSKVSLVSATGGDATIATGKLMQLHRAFRVIESLGSELADTGKEGSCMQILQIFVSIPADTDLDAFVQAAHPATAETELVPESR